MIRVCVTSVGGARRLAVCWSGGRTPPLCDLTTLLPHLFWCWYILCVCNCLLGLIYVYVRKNQLIDSDEGRAGVYTVTTHTYMGTTAVPVHGRSNYSLTAFSAHEVDNGYDWFSLSCVVCLCMCDSMHLFKLVNCIS